MDSRRILILSAFESNIKSGFSIRNCVFPALNKDSLAQLTCGMDIFVRGCPRFPVVRGVILGSDAINERDGRTPSENRPSGRSRPFIARAGMCAAAGISLTSLPATGNEWPQSAIQRFRADRISTEKSPLLPYGLSNAPSSTF